MVYKKSIIGYIILFIFTIAVIFGGTLILLNKNSGDTYVVLYNPILNTSKKVNYNNDINSIKAEDIDGYEFIGWYYNNNQNLPLSQLSNISNGTILKAFYSKIIIKEENINVSEKIENYNDKYITIKTYNNTILTYDELKTIENQEVKYLNIKDTKIESNTLLSNLFNNMAELETLFLPDSITEIGENSFNNCPKLKEIYFGNNLKIIKNNSFNNNKKIQKIKLSDELSVIEDKVFSDCNNLQEIFIGKNLEKIGEKVFINTNIQNIDINKENTNFKFKDGILYNYDYSKLLLSTKSISENVLIDENVKKINSYAFYNNDILKTIIIPSKIESIGEKSFYACDNLENVSFNNANNYIIDNSAFAECKKLKDIHFYNGLSELKDNVFKNCISLESVIFTISTSDNIKNITTFGDYVFMGCKNLVNFTIPETVKNIGIGLFYDCEKLEKIRLSSKIDKIPEKMFYQNINLKTIETDGKITEVGNLSFFNCINLKKIEFASDVKIIGTAAFENCKSIENLTFNKIETIKDYAFNNCENISTIDIKNVKTLGNNSFGNNKKLTSFTFNNLKEYDLNCFDGCENLKEISGESDNYSAVDGVLYNNSKTAILCYPFAKNDEDFTILATVLQISDNNILLNKYIKEFSIENGNISFYVENGVLYSADKTKLIRYPAKKEQENFIVPSYVKEICDYTFYGCQNLKTVEINSNVTKIGKNIFKDVYVLKTLKLPFIGETAYSQNKYISYLFGGNNYFDNDKLPQSLTNIEITNDNFMTENEFSNCKYIENIIINDKITELPQYVFSGCENLKKVEFKGKIKKISSYVFSGIENFEELKMCYDENLIIEIYYFDSLKNDISVIILSDEQLNQSVRSSVINKFANSYRRASWFRFSFKTND